MLFADLVAEGKACQLELDPLQNGATRGRGDSLVDKVLATQAGSSEVEFPAVI